MNLKMNFQTEEISHSDWVRDFCKNLFNAFGDKHLSLIASSQIDFAEAMIVPLIKTLLASKKSTALTEINSVVNEFFAKCFNKIKEKSNRADDSSLYRNKKTMKTMLEVAECIRIYNLK